MANQWFKFYGQEFICDPKMMSLSPIEKTLWVTLLCLVSSSEKEGMIKYINADKIKLLAGLDIMMDEWRETDGFLKRFEGLGMITIDNETIVIKNWEKRQRAMTPYERVKKYREMHKNDANDNEMITDDNVNDNNRIDKNRIDKNRKDDISERNIKEEKSMRREDLSPTGDRSYELFKKK